MKVLSCSLLLSSLLFTACGGSSSGSKDSTPAPNSSNSVAFSAMNAALSTNCAGSSCHSTGSRFGAFVGNQSLVDANLDDIYAEVSSGAMPLGRGISAEDKATILSYTRR